MAKALALGGPDACAADLRLVREALGDAAWSCAGGEGLWGNGWRCPFPYELWSILMVNNR